MTIEELLAATGLTANDLVPIYDAEAAQNVEPTQKVTATQLAAAIKVLASLVNTTEMNAAIAQSTAKYEQVTLTAGSGITINSQDCYTYGKFLIVYMQWTAAENISAYSNIASLGLSAKISWNAPLVTNGNVVVANNGLYADKGNSAIRASTQIPAGTYRTFLIIPTT